MTTIIFVFFISFLAALLLCPIVGRIGHRLHIIDTPSERKMHKEVTPRIGGVVLVLSFFLPLVLLPLNKIMFRDLLADDPRIPFFVIGLLLVFALGLWDDVKRLPAWIKFVGQAVCALIAFFGGIKITVISFPFTNGIHLGYFALPFTVFWFVLVINAINLIDGLDGLAAGISLFVSITMLFICLQNDKLLVAISFAALSGTLIGFLRYNFNPASIFMGDSGSYFLGYLLASLSILGSIKGQVATAMLIPVIALGIPLIDTLWAPIRRFFLGKKMFQPDTGHVHHYLIRLGYTHRRVVLIIYGFTILLGIFAILLIHARDEAAALILMVIGIGAIFLGRYIGVMDYFDSRRISRWIKDISDESGLSHERRSFLSHQLNISKAADINQFWDEVCAALEYLEFDHVELILYDKKLQNTVFDPSQQKWKQQEDIEEQINTYFDNPVSSFKWNRDTLSEDALLSQKGLLKVEQPLFSTGNEESHHFGTLYLVKDINRDPAGHFTLKRIEHLRRVMSSTLEEMYKS